MIWVIDTSSLIKIRTDLPRGKERMRILDGLSSLVDDDRLVYPRQVVAELTAYQGNPNKDELTPWAKQNKTKGCRHSRGELVALVSELLQDAQIARVLDPNKVTPPDEADIYVLALAVHLRRAENADVGVLTEDDRDKPYKLSLASACGLLRIVRLGIIPFLEQEGIRKP